MNLDSYKIYLEQEYGYQTYYNYISNLIKHLEKKGLTIEQLTDDIFRDFLYGYKSINTRNLFKNALRNFLNYTHININLNLKSKKPEQKRTEYPTKAELMPFLDQLEDKEKIIIRFCIESCCRKNELLTLKVENINLVEATVKLYGKGKKERIAPISLELAKILPAYIATGRNAFDISIDDFRGMLRRLSRIYGKNIHPHSLRHIGLTALYDSGLDIINIAEIAGHEDIRTTRLYIQIDEKKAISDYRKLIG